VGGTRYRRQGEGLENNENFALRKRGGCGRGKWFRFHGKGDYKVKKWRMGESASFESERTPKGGGRKGTVLTCWGMNEVHSLILEKAKGT